MNFIVRWLLKRKLSGFLERWEKDYLARGGPMLTGYKTVVVAVLQAAVFLLGWDQLTQYVSPQTIALINTALMIVLRFFTNSPIFKTGAAK